MTTTCLTPLPRWHELVSAAFTLLEPLEAACVAASEVPPTAIAPAAATEVATAVTRAQVPIRMWFPPLPDAGRALRLSPPECHRETAPEKGPTGVRLCKSDETGALV